VSRVVVLADDAEAPTRASSDDTVLRLNTIGRNPNVRLEVDVFRIRFLRDLPDRLDDLLRLAAFIYASDTRVSRGSSKDVFAASWQRTFRLVLPVWDLDFWNAPNVQENLIESLEFLTGDVYSFDFTQRTKREPSQGILQFKELLGPFPQVDVAVLFSGGTDSLAAVLESIQDSHHPILVSHRSAPAIDSRQKALVEEVRSRFSQWAFPHVSMWVNRAGGKRLVEPTQRSRSFLFTSLGVVTASLLDLNEVRLCDNGVVSINLPRSGENVGTFLSRSTHPRFLSLAQDFMRAVTGREALQIRNTFLFKTKKEVMDVVARSRYPELLQETVSCAHPEGKTKLRPHCGVCSQCIDRRFASVAAGLETHDLVNRYEKDIFLQALQDGADRTHAENYARFATTLESLQNADQFFETFPELYDSLPVDGDSETFGQNLWGLFQRHQRTVNDVLESQIRNHSSDIRQGTLPGSCLLRMVISGQHKVDPKIRYVERLRSLICKSIPAAFQTQEAKNERHVQDVGESIFQAAQETLERESPQIPFGVVTTKPDFAKAEGSGVPLFVEFKYVKTRARLNGIVTEMTSRVTVYGDQGAWILFIIYDPKRTITDDDKFIRGFEGHDKVWIGISR